MSLRYTNCATVHGHVYDSRMFTWVLEQLRIESVKWHSTVASRVSVHSLDRTKGGPDDVSCVRPSLSLLFFTPFTAILTSLCRFESAVPNLLKDNGLKCLDFEGSLATI